MNMKVDLSYTEMNWIVSALNHKIAALEDELKRADPGSAVGMLADVAITNNRNLVNKMTDAQNDMNKGRK
jgi:hypothetical protein